MALSASLTKVFETLNTTDSLTQAGLVAQTDGSYLFGHMESVDPGVTKWYRTTDNGSSWSARGQGVGSGNFDYCNPANGRENVTICPTFDFFYATAWLSRSTNNGSSWTITGDFQSAPTNSWQCFTTCVIAADRGGTFIAGGQFTASDSDPQTFIAVSTNNGVSWTPQEALIPGADGSHCSALCNAGGGRLYAAQRHWSGPVGAPRLYRSDNHGATWTDLGYCPLPGAATGGQVLSMTALDRERIAWCGVIGGGGSSGLAACWYSHDGGDTQNLVPASSIAGFPSVSGYNPQIPQIRRFTRDGIVLGLEAMEATGTPFCTFSQDGGVTYDVTPSAPTGGWQPFSGCYGNIVSLPEARLLIPVIHWPDFGDMRHQVYRCALTC